MNKKKNKTLRFVRKNSIQLLTLGIMAIGIVVPVFYSKTTVIVQNIPTPVVSQATWHIVETWTIRVNAVQDAKDVTLVSY